MNINDYLLKTSENLILEPQVECLAADPKFIPKRAHDTDAGADLVCTTNEVIAPGEKKLVDTGVAIKIPRGYGGLVMPRSSQRNKRIHSFGAGLIDSAYRGNIKVVLQNDSTEDYVIEAGVTKIGQLVIIPVMLCSFVDVWNDTERGTGGFGSTGA